MQLIDPDITVLYSRLLEQVRTDTEEGIPSYGSIVKKNIKGNPYWYHQYRFLGKQIQKALGVETDAEEWKEALRSREKLCALLTSGGMVSIPPNSQASNVLGLLTSAKVFDAGAVLVGSHAYGAICNMLGIRTTNQLTTTQDFDFGIDPKVRIAGASLELEQTLKTADMLPIPGFDRPPTASSFQTRDRTVRVDFLTPSRSGDTGKSVRIGQLGVHADELKYLGYLIEEPTKAVLITKYGTLVTVPQPARFALHKLIVATKRGAIDEAKRKKDIAQASTLLDYLIENRPFDIEEAWQQIDDQGWEKQVKKSFHMVDKSLLSRLLEQLSI